MGQNRCNKRVPYYKHLTGLCALQVHGDDVDHLVEMVSVETDPTMENKYHKTKAEVVDVVIEYADLTEPELIELVERRRRQLHVHSVAYYHLDSSFITDDQFDLWSKELVALYAAYPGLRQMGAKCELFEDWTGETGMHLRVSDDTLRVINSLRQVKTNHDVERQGN